MKIGFMAQEVHHRGGMERAAAEVLERMAQNHDVSIIALRCELPTDAVQWLSVRTPSKPKLRQDIAFMRAARRLVHENTFDVTGTIGAAGGEANVITAQFCHAAFVQRFGALRGRKSPAHRLYHAVVQRIYGLQEQRAYQSAELKRVIAVSEGIKRELMRFYHVPEAKIAVIPNAVDHAVFRPAQNDDEKQALRRKLGLPDDQFLCLFVGGDWDRKGLADAIRAISGLPRVCFVVVGRGDIARFQKIAAEAGVGAQVLFVGLSPSPQEYYAAADLFVFPSRYEAFSLVTIEAMACGLPVIARKINGTEDLIQDGKNGFFTTGAAEDIREKIQTLFSDPQRLVSLSQAARETSSAYTWDRVASEQIKIYDQAAGF